MPDARATDSGTKDTGASDVTAPRDVANLPDVGVDVVTQPPMDAGRADAGTVDAANVDARTDGGYPSCSMTWLDTPTLPAVDGGVLLEIPAEAGTLKVLLHGQVKSVDAGGGGGTQNYKCTEAVDAGTYAWVLTGPDAKLDDCNGTFLIEHTASDAGASRPQWASQIDTSIVVGEKIHAVTVSASAVPWLLLEKASSSGLGLLDNVLYVQRVNTVGGVALGTCDAATVGTSVDVPYTADYYFYGQ